MGLTNDFARLDQARFIDVELFYTGGTKVTGATIRQPDFIGAAGLSRANDIPGEFLFGVASVEFAVFPGVLQGQDPSFV